MNNREMEGQIKNSVEKNTPDVWERVQRDISHGKGEAVTMSDKKRKGKLIGIISGLAAALVLISAAVFGISNYSRADTKIVSTVAIEVNPEIKLSLNTYNVVLKAEADNEDGKKVLGKMKLEGAQLELAVRSIVSSMVEQCYLSDKSNTVLLSVENEDAAKEKSLYYEVMDEANGAMTGQNFNGCAVVQRMSNDKEAAQIAEKYGITKGKAEFIYFFYKDGRLRATLDELAKLSVNDLNLIFEGSFDHERYEYENINYVYGSGLNYSGKASDNRYIGVEKAKEIALKAAGIEEKHLLDFEIDIDVENGVMIYEVELESGLKEYDYDINALNGDIIKSSVEEIKNLNPSDSDSSSGTSSGVVSSKEQIKSYEATKIAFKDLGVTIDEATDIQVEYGEKDGTYVYEVEFKAFGCEYEYEIDSLGNIINKNKELDD